MTDENTTEIEVDPEELLRAVLHISPKDAEKIRDSAGTQADSGTESA
jgi:hypothetical protein